MSIKVELKGSLEKKEEISYPCIMVSNIGSIVLFKEVAVGTLLGYTDRWPKELEKDPIGTYTTDYYMNMFTPYTGNITIESNPHPVMDYFNMTLNRFRESYRSDHTKENKSNTPKSTPIEEIKYKTTTNILGKKSLTVCTYTFLDCKVGSGKCQGCPHFHDIDMEQSIVYCKYKGLNK